MGEPVTWDVLICHIPQRHDKLVALLAEFDRQALPGFGAIVYTDDREISIGRKCAVMTETSKAEYVCFMDDDDWPHEHYVDLIDQALQSRPDYVGFRVAYSVNGHLSTPVIHSLRYDHWIDDPDLLKRDISHLNPIRRDVALQGWWYGCQGGHGSDKEWANSIRALGLLKTEVFIDEPMYQYRFDTMDRFGTVRQPMPQLDELPAYPWLVTIRS